MKARFKDWLIINHQLFDIDTLLSKVTNNLDIINCNNIEMMFVEDILSEYLDTLSNQELEKIC